MSTSFQTFIQQIPVSPQYPLNSIAQSYLQDWYAGQSVAVLDGGIAFEAQLRQLNLDGSLTSLAQLDRFLTKVKPHLVSDYRLLDTQIAQKNLLTFIAFYAGMVWCYQSQKSAYWVSYSHLTQQYPALTKTIEDDFSYSLAVGGEPISETVDSRPLLMLGLADSVFFPLVTVIERLYPRRQTASQPQAPFFGYLNDSLENSVSQLLTTKTPATLPNPSDFLPVENHGYPQIIQLLPKNSLGKYLYLGADILFTDTAIGAAFDHDFFETVRENYQHPFGKKPLDKPLAQPTFETHLPNSETIQASQTLATTADLTSSVASEIPKQAPQVAKNSPNNTQTIAFTAQQTAQNKRLEQQQQAQEKQRFEQEQQQKIAEALANPQYHEGLLNQRKSMVDEKKTAKTTDIFSELEASLKVTSPSPSATSQSNPALQLAEQRANAILASEQRKTQRLAEEKLSGKLIKDISTVNQLTELGKPQELDSFDMLLPETVTTKANPDSTGNAEIDEQYFQTCQLLANVQQQAEPDMALVKQILGNLQQLAKGQHSGAMLQLALLRFRGEPAFHIAKDEAQALKLVQTAAKLGDHRAEKLLSKLYFSGQGVPLSTELGNYWLEQSASHGNAEAKNLLASMAIAQELRYVKQNDSIYTERLLMGLGALLVFALAIIFLVKT